MLSRFGLLLNTVVKIRRKEKGYICKMHHIERQNDFRTKNANNSFLSKIWECWTDVDLRIVKLESGGQQLPVIKKNLRKYCFTLEKSSFSLKVLKKICFTQITEYSIVTHLYYPELNQEFRFNQKQKRKISAYPIQPEKHNNFIKKSKLFDLKCAILNR